MPQQKLTPAEWEVMEVIWRLGGAPSVRQVLEEAYPEGEKAYTTVQTIMNTLLKKGFLQREKIGLVNFYSPTSSREDNEQAEVTSLVAKVFAGSIPAVANTLLSLDDLSLDEISEIKAMLADKERRLKGEES